MEKLKDKMSVIVVTLALAGLVAATSFAGMGSGAGRGSGSGGDSQVGKSPMERESSSREVMGRSAMDIGSMPEISTGGLGSGNMTMEVRPLKYGNGRLEFKYYANTHSVSLGRYDLMDLSTLEVDGKVYKPVQVDQMSGHHAGGKIIFDVPEKPASFRMVIRDLPKVEERTYEWN